MTDIGLKETAHGGNLAHRVPKKQLVALHLWQKQQKTALPSGLDAGKFSRFRVGA